MNKNNYNTKMQLIFNNLRLLTILFLLSSCSTSEESNNHLKLWYEQPATKWEEALPVGNGRLGAMVFGKYDTERIQLNEESLWAGSKINNNNPKALENLDEIRRLIFEDELVEAEKLADKSLLGTPPVIRSYQTMGDLYLDFGNRKIENYCRELDLKTGICQTSYSSEGVKYTEEVLASAPDNLIAIRLRGSKKASLNLSVKLEREKDAVVKTFGSNELIMEGQIIDEDDSLRGPGGKHMRFSACLKAIPQGGEIVTEGSMLSVKNADELLLLYTATTDYNLEKLNFDRSIDPLKECKEILDKTGDNNFETIKQKHLNDYEAIFNRVSLDLGGNERDTLPTDKRLQAVVDGAEDPGLAALYFQYGRYLLMGSSRFPGKLPANLQGIWCQDFKAPWNSDFHTNINLQMNYWPADVCNLGETVEPLTNFLNQLQKPGSATAREMYGTDGWTLHHLTDAFGRTGLMDGITWGTFPMGGPWMTFPLYRHFQFSGDVDYLRDKAYPVMKGSARFIIGFLSRDKNGNLSTAPSCSPENSFYLPNSKQTSKMTYSSTIDIEIITELFNNCINAASVLNTDHAFSDSLKAILRELPPVKISEQTGGIQEWINDYKETEPGHRHMSHLLGLYPGTQITSSTPELFDAAKVTISRRLKSGGGHTGWSRAWIINFYARLLDGEKAGEHLDLLFKKSTLPNLFDNHPPFQIDGNFGATAGIAEMLLQSHKGDTICLLPAIPPKWEKGEVYGLLARGGITVNMSWENNKLVKAILKSKYKKDVKIIYNGDIKPVSLNAGEEYTYKPD